MKHFHRCFTGSLVKNSPPYWRPTYLVVSPLVGGDGVVQPRGPVDGAVDAGVEDDEREEGDDDERERVGDHHVVAAAVHGGHSFIHSCGSSTDMSKNAEDRLRDPAL